MHDAAHFTINLDIATSTWLINVCHKAWEYVWEILWEISRSHWEMPLAIQANGEWFVPRYNLYLTYSRISVILVIVIHGFVTWIFWYFIWMLVVMDVIHEANDAYSIQGTWSCYWPDQFRTLAFNTWISSKFSMFHWIYLLFILCFFWWALSTLYKLYAVPVRVCSTREDMHYPWVISSVPVSHILSTREGMHYPWVISSVPVSHILSTCEDMQYLWVISSVPVSHILSTREDMQYPWVNLYEWRMNETSLTGNAYPHGYCISSRVLRIWLTGTDDMTHGYCISSRVLRIWLTSTAYPHGYWGDDSRVLMIWLTGNAYPHGYWGYDSRVLMIWLTGNAYPHGYCIPSRVLHIVYTGCWASFAYRCYSILECCNLFSGVQLSISILFYFEFPKNSEKLSKISGYFNFLALFTRVFVKIICLLSIHEFVEVIY